MNRYFDMQTRFWDAVYRQQDVFSMVHRQRHDIALRWVDSLGLVPGCRVLEVGCGAGRLTADLAARGYQVTAVDASQTMVETTRRRLGETGHEATVELGDAHVLAFEDAAFDLVVGLGLIPWLHSPQTALKEMVRVLGPGGYLLSNVDNRARLHARLDPLRSPALRDVRHAVRDRLALVGLLRPRPDTQVRVAFHRISEFDAMIGDAGLERIRAMSLGFGPFTLFGRELLPPWAGRRVNSVLQWLADRRALGLQTAGSQYLVLARQP